MSLKTKLIWNGVDAKIKANNTMVSGALETALLMQARAVSFAARDTGRLAGSIAILHKDQLIKNSESDRPGVTSKDFIQGKPEELTTYMGTNVDYAPDVEYGTGGHDINSPVKIRNVGWRYIKRHPGTRPQPFIRPAYDLTIGKSLTIFEYEGRLEFKEYFDEAKKAGK